MHPQGDKAIIDQATIDHIFDAAQTVEVASDFVTLRKRDVNYVRLCPFHNEKTPSFSVSPSEGLCKYFSYSKGGNAVHFIIEYGQMSCPKAFRYLVKKYNIEIKERELANEEKEVQSNQKSMFIVDNFARDYSQDILKNHVDGRSIGLTYFRQRNFHDDIIDKPRLGFNTEGRDALAQEAMRKGFKEELLVGAGLCYETGDHKLRDRFWGRVIFPVHTLSGRVVAFSGHVLSTENKKLARYVNSPESEIYHKSSELYGIYFAKQAIVKQSRCFLVEGYTDVISMHQSGVGNIMASSGTSLTSGQIQLIHRFTNNITVLYDGDMAGVKASTRGTDMLLEEGMNIKVCLLSDSDDPDSFIRKHNATEFQSFIQEHETDFVRFKAQLLMEDADKDSVKRTGLMNDIIRSIAVIPEAIVRDVYIEECGQLLRMENKLLVPEVAKHRELQAEEGSKPAVINHAPVPEAGEISPPFPPEETEIDTYQSFTPQEGKEGQKFYKYERLIIQMIIRYGEKIMCNMADEEGNEVSVTAVEYVINDLREGELAFHNPLHHYILSEVVEHIHEQEFISERFFVTHPDPAVGTIATELTSDRYQLSKYHSKTQRLVTNEECLYEMVPMPMINFKDAIVAKELKHIICALQGPTIANNNAQCGAVMRRYKEMEEIWSLMAKRLDNRVMLR